MLNLKADLAKGYSDVINCVLPFGKKEALRFGLDTGL
jgi:hypothetical protein